MSKYSLGFFSTCSPLYCSKLPDFKIHDSILKLLCEDYNVEIHVPMPCTGNERMMERVYKGDRTPLYHTLRGLPITFYPEIKEDLDLDGAFLENMGYFFDVEVNGKLITKTEQEEAFYRILDKLVERNKPILMLDNDYACTANLEKEPYVLYHVYQRYKDYDKLCVIAPMTQHLQPNVKFKHLPFPLDITTIRSDINPVENRQYLMHYVGNNFNKTETHVPVFQKLSKFGSVAVSGYRWSKEDKEMVPNARWRSAISLSHDNIYSVFGNSILGISGYSTFQRDMYKDLYHLRWKEFLIAGIYIVTENNPELISLMPEGTLVFDQIPSTDDLVLKDKLDYIVGNYTRIVNEQRDACVDFFDSRRLLPHYLEMLEIG